SNAQHNSRFSVRPVAHSIGGPPSARRLRATLVRQGRPEPPSARTRRLVPRTRDGRWSDCPATIDSTRSFATDAPLARWVGHLRGRLRSSVRSACRGPPIHAFSRAAHALGTGRGHGG